MELQLRLDVRENSKKRGYKRLDRPGHVGLEAGFLSCEDCVSMMQHDNSPTLLRVQITER